MNPTDCSPKLFVHLKRDLSVLHYVNAGANEYYAPIFGEFDEDHIAAVISYETGSCAFELNQSTITPILLQDGNTHQIKNAYGHYYFEFTSNARKNTGIKVEGEGHYIFKVSNDESGTSFVEESKFSSMLIPNLDIVNGNKHYMIFEAFSDQKFSITILFHSHDAHLLYKDR
jgi:hypothetical protein